MPRPPKLSRHLALLLLLALGCSAPAPTVNEVQAKNYLRKADVLLGEGDILAAAGEAEKAVRLAPKSAEAQAYYGDVMRQAGALFRAGKDDRAGYYRRARAALDIALALDPGNERARIDLSLLLHDSDRAQEAIVVLEPIAGAGHPEARFHLASILAGLGQVERAVGLYRAGLAEAPTNERAQIALGMLLAQLGRLEESRDEILVAIRANPASSQGFLQLGLVLGKLGVSEASLVAIARAADLDPRSQQAYYNLASALRRLGFQRYARMPERRFEELKEAARREQSLSERLAATPDDLDLRAELGAVYADNDDWTRARSAARNVLGRAPNHLRAHAVMARVLEEAGAHAAARAETETILAQNADNVEALALRGRIFLAEGNLAAARVDLERALDHSPDSAPLREDLGRLALAVGRADVALELVRPGLQLETPHPPLFKIAAEAMFRLGDREGAVKAFLELVSWMPADVDVLKRLAAIATTNGDSHNAARLKQRLDFILKGDLPPS